jgi:hypothetical protein
MFMGFVPTESLSALSDVCLAEAHPDGIATTSARSMGMRERLNIC